MLHQVQRLNVEHGDVPVGTLVGEQELHGLETLLLRLDASPREFLQPPQVVAGLRGHDGVAGHPSQNLPRELGREGERTFEIGRLNAGDDTAVHRPGRVGQRDVYSHHPFALLAGQLPYRGQHEITGGDEMGLVASWRVLVELVDAVFARQDTCLKRDPRCGRHRRSGGLQNAPTSLLA